MIRVTLEFHTEDELIRYFTRNQVHQGAALTIIDAQ